MIQARHPHMFHIEYPVSEKLPQFRRRLKRGDADIITPSYRHPLRSSASPLAQAWKLTSITLRN